MTTTTKEMCARPWGYVWRIDVLPGKVADFRKQFCDLSRFNKELPSGARFACIYETFIGKRNEPQFQVWFQLPSLAALEDRNMQKAVASFHKELDKYIDPSHRPWNEIVRLLE
jgi:hypothetical protein